MNFKSHHRCFLFLQIRSFHFLCTHPSLRHNTCYELVFLASYRYWFSSWSPNGELINCLAKEKLPGRWTGFGQSGYQRLLRYAELIIISAEKVITTPRKIPPYRKKEAISFFPSRAIFIEFILKILQTIKVLSRDRWAFFMDTEVKVKSKGEGLVLCEVISENTEVCSPSCIQLCWDWCIFAVDTRFVSFCRSEMTHELICASKWVGFTTDIVYTYVTTSNSHSHTWLPSCTHRRWNTTFSQDPLIYHFPPETHFAVSGSLPSSRNY